MSDPFDRLRNFDGGVESPDPKLIRDRARRIKARRYQAVGAMAAILVVATSALLFRPSNTSNVASPSRTATPSPSAESDIQKEMALVPGEPGGAEPQAAASEARAAGQAGAAAASSSLAGAQIRVDIALSSETASATSPATLRLTVCNDQPNATTLNFNNSQRFDLEVLHPNGSVAWRWASGKQFGQATGSETFAAGCRMVAEEIWDGTDETGKPLPPGEYKTRGRLTSNPPYESGTKKICAVACG